MARLVGQPWMKKKLVFKSSYKSDKHLDIYCYVSRYEVCGLLNAHVRGPYFRPHHCIVLSQSLSVLNGGSVIFNWQKGLIVLYSWPLLCAVLEKKLNQLQWNSKQALVLLSQFESCVKRSTAFDLKLNANSWEGRGSFILFVVFIFTCRWSCGNCIYYLSKTLY
jgi:hypothetical protein